MQDLNALVPSTGLVSARELAFGPDQNDDGAPDLYVVSANSSAVLVFDGVTGDPLGEFVASGYGGLLTPNYLTFGLNGDMYISGKSDPNVANNTIRRYNSATGMYLGEFVAPGSGGLLDSSGLAFGPDVSADGVSDLFVCSRATHQIKVYSGANGDYLGNFVTAGSGGLVRPTDLLFQDVDGDGAPELLVSSTDTDEVLLYNGTNGASLGAFIAAGGGGLDRPADMEIGPDGHLYVQSVGAVEVLRFNGTTGAFMDIYVQAPEGHPDKVMFLTFGPDDNLYLSSSVFNDVDLYQGPGGAAPGAFVAPFVFVDGAGWILITARDINNAGQIVGYGYPHGDFGEFVQSAYRYSPPQNGERFGTVENLGVPGPQSTRQPPSTTTATSPGSSFLTSTICGTPSGGGPKQGHRIWARWPALAHCPARSTTVIAAERFRLPVTATHPTARGPGCTIRPQTAWTIWAY